LRPWYEDESSDTSQDRGFGVRVRTSFTGQN
jgi:hypothetical protein